MRVFEVVGRVLREAGVEALFELIGDGNMRFAAYMADECGIQCYGTRHESAAVGMADGYARVTGKVGVCSVTQGPGFTNALTALTEATKASTPLLLLTGDTPTTGPRHNQTVNQKALAVALGMGYRAFRSTDLVTGDVMAAMDQALREYRPVVFSIPTNFQDLECTSLPDSRGMEPTRVGPIWPDPDSIAAAAEYIQRSRRPVILAGRGAVRSGAGDVLRQLGERIGALLTTSAVAKGMFAGDPFCIGVAGGFSTHLASELMSEADLILAFGASLNQWTMRHGTLIPPSAPIVQCDIDPGAMGALTPIALGILGDASSTAQSLLAALAGLNVRREGFRTAEVSAAIAGNDLQAEFEDQSTPERVDPRSLSIRLNALLPPQRAVVVDGGHFSGFPCIYLDVPDASAFVFPQDFMAVGLGLGNAMGAAVGRPDRITTCVIGDGGMMMSLGDLDTAVRYRLPLVIMVINDAAYGAEVYFLQQLGLPATCAQFNDPDFAAIAASMGATGLRIRTLELDGLASWIDHPSGPLLLDCKVNPAVHAEWFVRSYAARMAHETRRSRTGPHPL